jgi:hypothetical protein
MVVPVVAVVQRGVRVWVRSVWSVRRAPRSCVMVVSVVSAVLVARAAMVVPGVLVAARLMVVPRVPRVLWVRPLVAGVRVGVVGAVMGLTLPALV